MVFSSIPAYPDPPNWQQQSHVQQPFQQPNDDGNSSATTENNQQQFSHLAALAPQHPPRTDQGSSFIRSLPAGMADRARLAKLLPQQPDLQLVAQKCPRCDSANTKFCYFNNYSLTQPRHFCKTCRRYWTRGGALRNVPVGGGCRRNKRSSKASSRSKSPATSAVAGGSSTTSSATYNNNNNNNNSSSNNNDMNGNLVPLGQQPQLGFFNPINNFSNFGTGENLGLNFGEMGFLGGGFGNGRVGIDQWRIMPQPAQVQQQFHVLGGNLEQQQPSGVYRYDQNEEGVKQQALDFANLGGHVKNEQGLNILSRNFMDVQGNHDHDDDQYWGNANNINATTWSNNVHHLSGFNTGSFTTSHHF